MKPILILLSCIMASAFAMPGDYGYEQRRVSQDVPQVSQDVPPARRPVVPIVRMGYENDNQGKYSLDVTSGDKTAVKESGTLKDLGDKEGPVNVKSGSYSYVGPDQKTYTVNWTADERGFIATGEHLPTPPPIPEEIRRMLMMGGD